MIPFNVMSTDRLNLPHLNRKDYQVSSYVFPAARYAQLKVTSEVSVNRAILNLITVPDLRAAYLFEFKEEQTDWSVYQSNRSPLTEHEVRGAMILAMKQIKQDSYAKLTPTKIRSHSFIHFTKPIIKHLERFVPEDKVLIILIFKDYTMVTGNVYDETTLCRALLKFCPQKADRVISKGRSDIHNEYPFSFVQKRFLEESERKKELLLIS